ncbi:hypothetical protein [uncultured Thiodictyon sp.]|uniref:hypothetical protein n=1 Tax=uncultured Thiodictyon sp. TaxID=1846217 RepID=UPI0025FFDE32|nr:hypothetical protein [uncultured Thiodictyon sp.]
MSQAPLYPSSVALPGTLTLAPILTALALAGCAASPNQPTGVIDITVKPGDTGTCESTPCQVKLVMPPGKGTYEVTGNEVRVGTFPAGQTVALGGYWQSQKFAIVGAGVPPVYVYIPADR